MNSKIIIAQNIKMDRQYNNVLDYGETAMLNLVTSNAIAQANNYSFIRPTNSILVGFTYAQCLQANYIAFQNTDYSNKWFFAWIDEVIYRSDRSCEITYTVDSWSTWFDKWTTKQAWVIREHVNDDTIGINTVPENIETGDYISAKRREVILNNPASYYICMAVTELPDGTAPFNNTRVYNGVYGGLYYLAFTNATNCTNAIKIYQQTGKADAINSVFMIPNNLSSVTDGDTYTWTQGDVTTSVIYLDESDTADTVGILNASMPTNVGKSYIPKNKKLFTFPYSFMNLTNNAGSTIPFRYEDFAIEDGARVIGFWIDACLTPGMSMKILPLFYKNENINYNFGLMCGKIPVCSWITDVYVNWLRQNELNAFLNISGSVVGLGTSLATGNVIGAIGTGLNIANSVSSIYTKSLTPDQASGNTNSGDVNFSESNDGAITLYYMTIKDEYAKIIDDYFTRFGYKINQLKTPNITGRPYWNYVQIGDGESIGNGSVPSKFMKDIDNACQKGVTIWHNHSNIGNFSLDNSI